MLSVEDLIKDFGRVRIINSSNFNVEKDEIVSLVGPNGAGKTTLVNLISGHLRPDSGRILLDDRDITHVPVHVRIARGIARNFQITQLFEELTVLDNVRNCIFSVNGQLGGFSSRPVPIARPVRRPWRYWPPSIWSN